MTVDCQNVTVVGTISITSTPSEAEIWIAPSGSPLVDQAVTTPNTMFVSAAGDYDIKLVKSGYLDYTETVNVPAETGAASVVATFAGSAYITSIPSGAQIFLAVSPGTPVDQGVQTPSTFTGLTLPSSGVTNTWDYKLTFAGYADSVGSFLATAGSTINVPIVDMLTVADIRATSIITTPSATPCIEGTCTIIVDVTWINNGETSGTFIPNISIDGTDIDPPPYPSQSLGPGLTETKTFTLTELTTAGSPHTICPSPN